VDVRRDESATQYRKILSSTSRYHPKLCTTFSNHQALAAIVTYVANMFVLALFCNLMILK
jgi:hypothetical protein